MEQRSCIKCCDKNTINGRQTFEMLQKAFGDETLSGATVFDWPRLFIEGRELDYTFVKCIITGDETLVWQLNVLTK